MIMIITVVTIIIIFMVMATVEVYFAMKIITIVAARRKVTLPSTLVDVYLMILIMVTMVPQADDECGTWVTFPTTWS